MTGLSKTEYEFAQAFATIQGRIHHTAKTHGFWEDIEKLLALADECGKFRAMNSLVSTQKLCLIHSEISEAMEGDRKNLMDDKLPHRTMEEVELADAIIRIMDYAEFRSYNLAEAIIEKHKYNETRPYKHGKGY